MEILLRTLGLSNAADTMVGNSIVRGVSGGERKRVTSAEMLVGPKVLSDAFRTSCSLRFGRQLPCSVCPLGPHSSLHPRYHDAVIWELQLD